MLPSRTPRRTRGLSSSFSIRRDREICLELPDHSVAYISATHFFQTHSAREPNPLAARLAEQFITQNRSLFNRMGVFATSEFNGQDVRLRLQSNSVVGAVPLLSPTSAVPDYGLVIHPRFSWTGIGTMLADMGWRVVPTMLKLPLLRRSERRIPPWVISSMILARLDALLKTLDRRFEIIAEDQLAPKGTVDWGAYASKRIASGKFTSIPCSFPDLRDDSMLKGAIRFALEKHLQSLQTQREHGSFVHRLIEYCLQLIQRVINTPARLPSRLIFDIWLQRPMRYSAFLEGVQAIEWTAEERGLAGLSDLEGIPWMMSMDTFFEAWLETVFQIVARQTGATQSVGRLRQTVHPIAWERPHLGSQKSLIPDLWLEWTDTTMIVDAKYKRHFQELQQLHWNDIEGQIREAHRSDLFQVLAYASLSTKPNIIACLAYPCNQELWDELKSRNALVHKAQITGNKRNLKLWLTAIPIGAPLDTVIPPLVSEVRRFLA